MPLSRVPHWQSALESFFRDNASRKFRYGRWDCCLFACDAIKVMTGVDTALPFRGNYHTQKGAMAAVRAYAGKASVRAVADKITAIYQMQSLETSQAQRGDLMLLRRPKDFSLGILAFNGLTIVTVTPDGLQQIPLSTAVKGWRV